MSIHGEGSGEPVRVYNLNDAAGGYGWRSAFYTTAERNQGTDAVIREAIQSLEAGTYTLLLVWSDGQVRISEVTVQAEKKSVAGEAFVRGAVRP